ncbi:o-succinylbenzoate--CoA ligase [Veillonella sp. CNR 79/14]|uniref:o-succinylbenzoate--CoA ligase n=1 Tax=Veillonella sp. CNR 79/14 TaxID=2490954 RepID=UPI000F8DE556|nr:o-succinylbenzoate--CoA ligase [Veillonella sp. CNR 79/14]
MKWLYERAHTHRDRLFLNKYSYGDVFTLTIATAKRLAPHLRGESRIALWAENSVSMAIHLFALSALGIETLLLNTNLTNREITEQMESTGVRTLLMSEKMTHILRAQKVADDIEITDVSTYEYSHNQVDRQYLCFSTCIDTDFKAISPMHNDENLDLNPSGEKVFCIINTSATTGKFKSVPVRWLQIEAHVKASANVLGVEEHDNWLVVLPMFHVSGLSIILRTLYNGTRATIREKFSEQVVLEALKTDEVTMVSLVPTVLQRIVERIQVPTLRAILLGGEFIPMPLLQECVQRNLPVYKTYGMSETFAQSTTFSIQEYPNKLASVGYPLQGVTIEIRNPDEEGVGEVWLSSPMLMKGYLNKELIKGAFNTDDIGYVDEDGFLYLLNRRKDIIISGGENIYPKEIEDILYGMDGIQECAVIPVSDPKWGQVPVLCVVTNCSKEDISQYLLSRLAKYKVPKRMIYFDALPKNSMGKILRQDLIHTVERA